MIVLDTNVISALMDPARNAAVVAWMNLQPDLSVWTTSITILELRFGIERLAAGRRKNILTQSLGEVVRIELAGRILAFGEAEAEETAALMARRRVAGRPTDANDAMIAGIVRVNRATLATRNVRHFEDAGIAVVDPWTA